MLLMFFSWLQVIRKKYGPRRPGLTKLTLRKLVLLHKANVAKKAVVHRERAANKKKAAK